MEEINYFMDDSITDVSPTIIDIIDLTKESPNTVRRSRSQRRNDEDVPSNHNIGSHSHRIVMPIPPIVLGNTQDIPTRNTRNRERVSHATSSNEVLTLDNTMEEDKICYTVESDAKEPIPLTCPICFEVLSSKLKPYTTRCGHLFCSECLQTFLRTAKKCPTCKATVALRSCTRLYF
ncbi:PREDICTED: E3 ubiquitin-protein ligase RNF4-like [Cyphomyrmex costatus]|uniref:E3 ubiquitin-protein ligase RNF4-like n=1 Tax=Cyphomyrmex costatus TaxID=456900 RepID=UPI0008523B81|nr:PREDICTED: E3 ubiquitin-protein ligase RNF4-like [Cyphomyrmex costatus]